MGKACKSNKQSRTTNKSNNEGNDDASTSKDDQKENNLSFTLGSDIKGKPRKQQLKKVHKLNTRKAFNKSQSDKEERAYLDNGCDSFGL